MIALLMFGAAVALAFAIGAHDGRERERRRVAKGQISRWEADLLRSRGVKMHPNPSEAGRYRRAVITR